MQMGASNYGQMIRSWPMAYLPAGTCTYFQHIVEVFPSETAPQDLTVRTLVVFRPRMSGKQSRDEGGVLLPRMPSCIGTRQGPGPWKLPSTSLEGYRTVLRWSPSWTSTTLVFRPITRFTQMTYLEYAVSFAVHLFPTRSALPNALRDDGIV